MRSLALAAQITVRVTGLIQILVGLLYWAGFATGWIDGHRGIGYVFAAALIILAVVAYRAGVQPGLVGFTIIWALLVPAFGLAQTRLMPGSAHWIVRLFHLVVGVYAIRLGEELGKRIRTRLGAPASR